MADSKLLKESVDKKNADIFCNIEIGKIIEYMILLFVKEIEKYW